MLSLEDILMVGFGSFRMGGLLASMPVFGTTPIPIPLKFFLAIGFSLMVLPFQPPVPATFWQEPSALFLIAFRELGLGLFMGFMMRFLFVLVTMALELAGLQMGFGIATFFDPMNNSQVSVVAHLGAVLTILFFFVTNLHHEFFFTVVKSFERIPIGLPTWDMGTMLTRLLSFIKSSFEVSLRLSFPVLVAMLVLHLVMGLIARTAPQMNLFFNMAFILNIVTGLILVSMSWPRIFPQVQKFARALTLSGYGLW